MFRSSPAIAALSPPRTAHPFRQEPHPTGCNRSAGRGRGQATGRRRSGPVVSALPTRPATAPACPAPRAAAGDQADGQTASWIGSSAAVTCGQRRWRPVAGCITLSWFSQLSAMPQLVGAHPRGGVVDRSGHHAGAIGCEQYRAVGRVLGERGNLQDGRKADCSNRNCRRAPGG